LPYQSQRVSGFGTTIFAEMSALAAQHNAVNLGQGFPDFDGPDEIKDAAIQAIQDGINQYAISSGATSLRQAVSDHAARFYGQEIDPNREVVVTSGATEALFSTAMGLIDPGDEAIIFEPFYDSYVPDTIMAGGVPRYVPLRPDGPDGEWVFDPDELKAAFNDRTKLIFVNTPHNPTGKVYTEAELTYIAKLCQQWDVIAVSDEVYEHIVFEGHRHVRLATLPGMADRTITISSQGKSFSFTGWKVGWVIAAPPLRQAVQQAHQFVSYATAAPFQEAAAVALNLPDKYFQALADEYEQRRDFLCNALEDAGLRTMSPAGTYFVTADFSSLDLKEHGVDDDVSFCKYLTSEVGVAAIPPTAFYSDEHKPLARHLARFAFCKTQPTLEEAARRLENLTG
jgi:N-succinyldiaminopimelate aminotransferase